MVNTRTKMKDSGFYILLIRLPKAAALKIGAKEETVFPSGWYIYVGSSANSLSRRVLRHASRDKKKHWHIDYLLESATLKRTFIIHDHYMKLRNSHSIFSSVPGVPFECALSDEISLLEGGGRFFNRFGSGDCTCPGHLLYFKTNPEKSIIEHFKILNKFDVVQFENR